ncbi:MAG: rRNA maturation RNase YbeY [Candidatus Schekmanbacteria bacterium RIFCSPHIGHO2_02_FULL_38_11]|uniref:Endoribonuclease YbeY n=1 Tax=Candidatus Schekmanbacteria bacterium RIFCSPLOWO2_12_FULL_38_15 TaxID=1817883 RepID=A0A1F7SQH3_9BACT|nr:MAG: rRNA maturation RNase YbeY [Candidatus Schekmanbacteria bacterium GWA2_38_9]OGL48499.1 MAG: rRNA maturation RNase YbeY [Candidatus Schekmanbacteria bacterium RIFCSPHIGHO2_02_FULL_38_11]OGL50235.1 MAG: rRNA maturation RNase YbeY [Candidatus Schekmanbacteria bacterium RIFCSPLOWO2_02_FULL_38_14]OGL55454.1 MAG: rRNA maturation RNase YbeY [Candidatus Schekmanbacteria bacterium RIFCSPLOWO2_12_FULL_38_15]
MKITIQNISKTDLKIDTNKLKKHLNDILAELGEKKASLNIVLVNNEYIKELNLRYRKINRATDILAFTADQEKELKEGNEKEMGDIAISLEMAKLQSKIFKNSLEKEVTLLLTHGVLHLLGYDHHNKKDEEKMNSLQKELMEKYYKHKN